MSAKSIVFKAIRDNTTVQSLIGTDEQGLYKVYQTWFNKSKGFPQITLTRVTASGGYAGDNDRKVLATPIQIDIWNANSPTAIEEAVITALNGIDRHMRSEVVVVNDTSDSTEEVYRTILQITIYE